MIRVAIGGKSTKNHNHKGDEVMERKFHYSIGGVFFFEAASDNEAKKVALGYMYQHDIMQARVICHEKDGERVVCRIERPEDPPKPERFTDRDILNEIERTISDTEEGSGDPDMLEEILNDIVEMIQAHKKAVRA